ncbi:biotin--[acetyl-CoA-carboxylase] ligase [Fructobacillus sp. M1-13]|uniref:biotin--[biotin carboxyl-carrier protein] ligase n=1 Tax=Fructobacillus papyriferae TaxID=2713171 RepID=A0ABS5QPN8_9LACO|nr:biotin--[acetyl-CoA-carboxylase] ligase [Fructobacillus papyriferae]MBS9334772.1 biotin--[acetyl-CoA-carboxylase] ligase [Fructobacillus papyriferae]MCD2158762.1 biotin--[acetyl-CoA-carboxylase] ligase [Fructobacillus papyriferae]
MTDGKPKTKDRVLADLLAQPGQYLSGDQLAADLAISRESVWKAVKSLQKDGHRIVSKKKTGYAYLSSDHVDEQVVDAYLEQLSAGQQGFDTIQVFDDIGSTQTYAKDYLAVHPAANPAIFTARTMGAGYGRRGRAFFAPKDKGLYVSLSLPINPDKAVVASLLTTSAASVIAQVLEETFDGLDVSLKWVNDLIVKGHKVGGIITEAVFDMETQQYNALVLGFFVNVLPADYPAEIEQKAMAVLDDPKQLVDWNFLLAQLILALVKMNEDYQDGHYLADYRKRSFLIGQEVSLQVGSDLLVGTVTGISDQAGLELRLTNGEKKILYAGEVTKVKLHENLNL